MKRYWLVTLLLLTTGIAGMTFVHAEQTISLLPIKVKLQDKAALKRGAKFFMNYCAGCHALRYVRYNRMVQDLGLTTNIIFTHAKPSDSIKVSLLTADAQQWFGVQPPDLSLITRQHSASWLYTYLHSFYQDTTRPFNSNNVLVPDVAMPDVLAPLRGEARLIASPNGSRLIYHQHGSLSNKQFNDALHDVVTFLVYVGEPAKLVRYRLGYFVLGYLAVLLIVVCGLRRLYNKSM